MNVFTLPIILFTAYVSAQSYDVQSDPFRLILQSGNATLDGTALGACHQGAAIEGLCLTTQRLSDTATSYTTFYHNVSASDVSDPTNVTDVPGLLGYTLHAGANLSVPSTLSIHPSVFSNVADLIISPGTSGYTTVSFDDCGTMYLGSAVDDTVTPPTWPSSSLKLTNWYVCLTRWGYLYWTLNWKVGMGGDKPQNPSCSKVSVKRVYVGDEEKVWKMNDAQH